MEPMRRNDRRHRHRAFTLVEVLATVVVLAIAAVLAIPILSGRGEIDSQAAARRLLTDLAFAQSDAIAHQEHRRIHFLEDGTGWCVLRIEPSELDDAFDPATARFVADPLAGAGVAGALRCDFGRETGFATARIEDVEIDGASRAITFDPLGGTVSPAGSASGGGSLVIRSPEAALRIEFAPLTGRARVVAIGADASEGQ